MSSLLRILYISMKTQYAAILLGYFDTLYLLFTWLAINIQCLLRLFRGLILTFCAFCSFRALAIVTQVWCEDDDRAYSAMDARIMGAFLLRKLCCALSRELWEEPFPAVIGFGQK